MDRDVHDALASQFDRHSIVRRLRHVPPHEVYEVRVDGRHAVFKRDTGPTGRAATEGRVTAFVGRETSIPVPEVLAVGDGWYVAGWHPDAPAPDAARVADGTWPRAAGRGLATLHDESDGLADRYGRFRLDDGGPDGAAAGALAIEGHDDWHAAARAYVHDRRSAIADYGHADVADEVLAFLDDHPDAFAGAHGPVCCHGWWTPEHVAIDDGAIACVVDFEHALAAPGEFDYWRSVLPTFRDDAGDAQRAFRAGYESVRALPEGFERRAPLYVLLNEVYYLESLHVQAQHGPEETADRAAWFRERIDERLDARR
jgi:fructosamine-3-kinase